MKKTSDVYKRFRDVLLLALLVVLVFPLVGANHFPQSISEGASIYQEKCQGCHTIGGGDLVGPDLKGITQRSDPQWLVEFIAAPDQVLASGDPIASALLERYGGIAMPNQGLSREQVAAVIVYLESQAEGGPVQQPTTHLSELPGDVARGQDLFMGNQHFQNEGPPCMGCHNIDSNGLLGGGVLGPDLTDASSRYSTVGLASALANMPWPTMKPIFSEHPLTLQEQVDLLAFIEASAGQQETDKEPLIFAISLFATFAVVGLIGLVYRQRLQGVRRPLLNKVKSGS